jgi:hypothetical protein
MRYRRLVVKLSGAAPAGPEPFGFSSAALGHVARELPAPADGGIAMDAATAAARAD